MKWTFINIRYQDAWHVPDILKNGDVREFEDALTALQFADYQCHKYNKTHEHVKKIAILDSLLHTSKPKSHVYIGQKARERLELSGSDQYMTVHNVIIFQHETNWNTPSMGFGVVVAKNGETQSVRTSLNFTGTTLPDNMQWTNMEVQEMKKRFGYPINSFFPESERLDAFLLPNPTSENISGSSFQAFKDTIRGVDMTREVAQATAIPPSLWNQPLTWDVGQAVVMSPTLYSQLQNNTWAHDIPADTIRYEQVIHEVQDHATVHPLQEAQRRWIHGDRPLGEYQGEPATFQGLDSVINPRPVQYTVQIDTDTGEPDWESPITIPNPTYNMNETQLREHIARMYGDTVLAMSRDFDNVLRIDTTQGRRFESNDGGLSFTYTGRY